MQIVLEQIAKAKARAAREGIDVERLNRFARDKNPAELNSDAQLADRAEFLRQSLGDERKSEVFFERIIAGSELQDVNYLARGARAAKAVARIVMRDRSGRQLGWGTGFLIAPNVLITNNHVLPDLASCVRSQAQFEYELDIDGQVLNAVTFALDGARLFHTSKELDFTVVAVTPKSDAGEGALEHYGFLPLVGSVGKVADGEWLTIVQHPGGDRKQVCVRENKLLKRTEDVLWYSTDTLGGSSGSPAFNNDWYVVALHHSGVAEEKDGRVQTLSGQDFDPASHTEADIKWIANEGIRVSRIVQTLQAALPDEVLLRPVFQATPENARLVLPSVTLLQAVALPAGLPNPANDPAPIRSLPQSTELPMNDAPSPARTVNVTLSIDGRGNATVVRSGTSATEAAMFVEAAKKKPKPPSFDAPFNGRYDDRKGYNDKFLDPRKPAFTVSLPTLSAALAKDAADLVEPEQGNKNVLRYHGYSVVMHAKRRFAIYSAANVDFAGRFDLPRPADVWRQDPRVAAEVQLGGFYYASNQFDRGHLTRREDMEYGSDRVAALQSAADTCHWTNCTPQHARFNQNKELWQGIERHIFEEGVQRDGFRAQVITGPVLDEGDPIWDKFPKIQYPVKFWKVVAAVTASKDLFATAYVLDQSDVIAEFGIEAAREVPFDAFKTFQVPIADIEELTQLKFTGGAAGQTFSLRDVDPLAKVKLPKHAAKVGVREAALIESPPGWLPLESLDTMVVPD